MPKPMNNTGERFLPELSGEIALEHLHRYELAREYSIGKSVLDIASGEGYGSSRLAQVADSVVGVDVSEKAILHAERKYGNHKLRFIVSSCEDIPCTNHSVDVVVSFETLEHLEQHERMMQEIKRVMRPGGLLVISTPDKFEYSDRTGNKNPFHVRELYRDEFAQLLHSNFRNVQILWQRVIYGSTLLSIDDKAMSVKFHVWKDGEFESQFGVFRPLYFVAVATDWDLPIVNGGIFEIPNRNSVPQSLVQDKLDAIEQSTSWKITAPIRFVVHKSRRFAVTFRLIGNKIRGGKHP